MPTDPPTEFAFVPTVLVVARDNTPYQVCRLVCNPADVPRSLTVRIRRPGLDIEEAIRIEPGDDGCDVLVPESESLLEGHVEVVGDGVQWQGDVRFEPVRRWQVFFVNHSHTDIGFTHPPSVVVDIHNKNLEQALTLSEATGTWPDDARFRWTCESSWQVQNFLAAHPDQEQRLVDAVLSGSVEIEGLYIHSYFDLLSREQLTRSLGYAQRLRDDLALPVTSAMISDVPGCPWSLVDLMAAAGIRYLSMAPNNFLAPFLAFTDMPRPFYWDGPAGGRVLVWYTSDPSWAYIEGARLGFWQDIAEVERKLPERLRQLEGEGYPFDAIQVQLGSDNRPLRLSPSVIARDWNQRYVSPQIRIATPSEFFRHAERHWSDRLPVYRGEWQSSWSQTTLHYPHEANQSRRNHGTLTQWERFAVLADWVDEGYRYPAHEIARAYDASLVFDEHSGPKGIWLPRSESDALGAVREGYAIFQQATHPAQNGMEEAIASATSALAGGDNPQIVVWNTLGWPGEGFVSVVVPDEALGASAGLVDDVTGELTPFELVTTDGATLVRFEASGVPAIGFKRYRLIEASGKHSSVPSPAASVTHSESTVTLANDALSVTVDAQGRIIDLAITGSGVNLVDGESEFRLNELVRYVTEPHGPEAGGSFTADRRLFDGVPIEGAVRTSQSVTSDPPSTQTGLGHASVTTVATFDELYQWRTTIALAGDRIEIENELRWLKQPDDSELLYVAFPFALPKPEIRHSSQFAVVDPQTQTLSGSNHDFFAIQHWLGITGNTGHGVVVSSSDLALVDFGGINHLRFHRGLEVDNGHILFRAASGRGVDQEAGSPFGQSGAVHIRFAIRPFASALDTRAAHQFGERQAVPLQARYLQPRHPGFWTGQGGSFVELTSETAMVTGLKRAERAPGHIVQVWESCGERSLCTLGFPSHELLAAWKTTPLEQDLGLVGHMDGLIQFELGPYEIATFRCILGR